MVDVGSIQIIAGMDTSQIEAGLSSIKESIDNLKNSSRTAFGDVERLGSSTGSLLGLVAKIGTTIGGLGLIGLSPQFQAFIEPMKAEFFRLSTIVGESLVGGFEKAQTAFTDFVNFMSGDGRPILDAIGSGFSSVIDQAVSLADDIRDIGSAIAGLEKKIEMDLGINLSGIAGKVFEDYGMDGLIALMVAMKNPVAGLATFVGLRALRGIGGGIEGAQEGGFMGGVSGFSEGVLGPNTFGAISQQGEEFGRADAAGKAEQTFNFFAGPWIAAFVDYVRRKLNSDEFDSELNRHANVGGV